MKLVEIFGTPTRISKNSTSKEKYSPKDLADIPVESPGKYAVVFGKKSDQHLVSKISRRAAVLENDAYFQYAMYVLKHHLAENNTYFPRIYNVRIITSELSDSNNPNQWFKVDMEQLSNLSTIEEDALIAMIARMMNVKIVLEDEELSYDVDDARDDYDILKGYANNVGTSFLILHFIIVPITRYLEASAGRTSLFKDHKLVEAMDIIKDVKETNSRFGYDIHEGNLMLRNLSSGSQLVFTDPLWNY